MNKHILLVMKWLSDKESVSQEELEANWNEAWASYLAVDGEASWEANWAAHLAAGGAADWKAGLAVYSVDEYFEKTGEDRSKYEKELNK